jgi:pre-mRNA-splicing helicase BRR2
MDVDSDQEGGGEAGLKVQEIDAYWLQRKVSTALPDLDAAGAQALAGQVAAALEEEEDAVAETKVVQLLGLDQFELAKELLRNRLKIVWVVRLRQAQDDAEVALVEAQMAANPATVQILNELRATRTSARERQSAMERSIREEARRLRHGTGGGGEEEEGGEAGPGAAGGAGGAGGSAREGAAAGRQMVDLESLAFTRGGHFMSNKSCQLPQGSYRCAGGWGWGGRDVYQGGCVIYQRWGCL